MLLALFSIYIQEALLTFLAATIIFLYIFFGQLKEGRDNRSPIKQMIPNYITEIQKKGSEELCAVCSSTALNKRDV